MSTGKKERIQRIYFMLLEMANGNFFHRLERSGKEDDIEAVETCLNMLAEEIQESLTHQSYANSKGVMKHIVQMCFLLDDQGIIQMINQNAYKMLSYLHKNIINKPFISILTKNSKSKWSNVWNDMVEKDFFDTSLELTFKTSEKLLLPSNCYITAYKDNSDKGRKILVTVVLHSKVQQEIEKELKLSVMAFESDDEPVNETKPNLTFEDIKKIRAGYESIINNPEKDFPSLKDFALLLGTNEFKLKYGFKELYGTSVHQFLINERLRKAKMLVQYSDLSLKSIAHKTGFKSISHFSRSFKKRYEYNAKTLRRQSQRDT
tara:strand:+ start:6104 stop:7060 length:957 start_codon:yes stop_codon:yes gene_type:complete